MADKKNKNAIITGAAMGIGLGIAKYFAAEGYNLSLIDKLDIPKLEYNVTIDYYKQDITDFKKASLCVDEILKKIETVDVLVNDAGILKDGLLDASIEDICAVVNTNVIAHFNVTKQISEKMKKQKSGYIFNIASRNGLDAKPELGIYAISKFGLMGFNEALYEEMAKYNVKVTALCPSVVNTDMAKNSDLSDEDKIPVADLVSTINCLLKLTDNTCVREIYIDCHESLLKRLK